SSDQRQVFEAAQVCVQIRLFRHVAEAAFEPNQILANVAAMEQNLARAGIEPPREHLDRGALTGTVRSHVAEKLTRYQREVQIGHGWDPAIPLCQAPDFKHGVAAGIETRAHTGST